MKKMILLQLFIFVCSTGFAQKKNTALTSVSVDTILKGEISIRAILIDKNTVWYAADKSRFGFYDTQKHEKFESKIPDSDALEFRSIGQTSAAVFVLNTGNPASLYKISKPGNELKIVYQEDGERVFYDSMQFWNDRDGIAVGDPVENCLSIITTHDGGNSWRKIPCSDLPKVADGEAAFAASNTNVIVKSDRIWIVSGGKKSRIFYSSDFAKSWQVFETPIVQGLSMTGIFTADFYDAKTGFIAGGNYELPNLNSGNKAITTDGGKTWKLRAEREGFGYASCIQYIPQSNGKRLVCVGASGLQYSADSGKTWKKLLDAKNLYTIRFINASTAIAAGRNCLLELHFN